MKRFLLLLCVLGAVLWLGKFSAPPLSTPQLCLGRPFLVPQIVFFIIIIFFWKGGGLPFFPSVSWPLSFLPLFFLFPRPCLIHARIADWGRAFVHGHTFLHSWSGPMTLACCMELRSCPILLLFSSCLL